MNVVIAYIGLGSNLCDPEQQVTTAIQELSVLPDTSLIAQSSLYHSPPMGPSDQPDYINAVVGIETRLTALDLLDELQRIERNHQRVRTLHWGPRTLDLDILLYGQQVILHDRLTVPHPGLTQRQFVINPLLEIVPQLILPDGTFLADLTRPLVPGETGGVWQCKEE